MKKIILLISLGFFTLGFSQSQNSSIWDNNNYGYYTDDYFDDDYYYNYPSDFYNDRYYSSFYNDYRRSIYDINWDRVFTELRLSPYQMSMIIELNNQFPTYSIWDSYYRPNPNRWYYDRFYALQQILGPRLFVVFQNRYYRGNHPIVYYRSYVNRYYRPGYYINPHYRNVNVNIYQIDKQDYRRAYGNHYGWNPSYNRHDPQGFKNDNRVNANSRDRVFRNENSNSREKRETLRNNNGFRNSDNNRELNNSGERNSNQSSYSKPATKRLTPRSNGFRSGNSTTPNNATSRPANTETSTRSGGFRTR